MEIVNKYDIATEHDKRLIELNESKILGELKYDVYVSQKRIDAIGKRSGITYIIESKEKLNFESFGQVIIYEYLYKQTHREITKKGIVCSDIDDAVFFSACMDFDIHVFELTDNGINEHKP